MLVCFTCNVLLLSSTVKTTSLSLIQVYHLLFSSQNIMFTSKSPNSDVKLIDFGLSKKYLPSDRLSEGVGTICESSSSPLLLYLFAYIYNIYIISPTSSLPQQYLLNLQTQWRRRLFEATMTKLRTYGPSESLPSCCSRLKCLSLARAKRS